MLVGQTLPSVGYPKRTSPTGHRDQFTTTVRDEVCLGQTSGGMEGLLSKPLPRQGSGILYIVDHFQAPGSLSVPGPFGLIEHVVQTGQEHGHMVARASREGGFRGPLLGVEASSPDSNEISSHIRLWLSSDDPKVLSLCLDERMASDRARGLSQVDQSLQRVLHEIPQNSVVNLSQGHGQSNLVDLELSMLTVADPDNAEEQKQAKDQRKRMALALGLDAAKFSSDNKEERVQVWPDVLQALLDRAAATDQDGRVRLAKAAYDESVKTLTSWGNSVVVSAGNEQQLPSVLEENFAHGRDFRFHQNFLNNDLINSDTIAVGALHEGEVAEYSSRIPSVHIYACGDLGEHSGTSFAAPRVSAVLAALQGADPGLDGKSAERLLRQHFCIRQELDSEDGYFLHR